MSSFTYGPVVRPHPDKPKLFIVERAFSFYLNSPSAGPYVEVPVGALTNGASVPPFVDVFFPQWHPDYSAAATLHDAMVGEHGQITAMIQTPGKEPRVASWDEAARWFKIAMAVKGTSRWKRSAFYHAVMLNKRIRKLKRLIGLGRR